MTKMKKLKKKEILVKKECEIFEHDFKHLTRKGRATAFCPKCGKDVMLLLVYALDTGLDLTK